MKLAIVSDIHADAAALRRVLDDMPPVDRVLCAGDAVSEFQFCPETVGMLREVGAQCIHGNHEHVLFERNPGYLARCRAQFDAGLVDWLAAAPTRFDLEAAGARVHMVHATPWSPFTGYIFPTSPQLPRLAELTCDYVIMGHTHIPMVVQTGSVTAINPGSCSQPRGPDRRGSYALLDLATREAVIRYLPA